MLDHPSRTNGTRRYVGQAGELGSNGSFGATYDLGCIGRSLANIRTACASMHSIGDQPLLNQHLDIQVGILPNK